MKIHSRIGLVFAAFCAGLVVWHICTPANPHHWIAMITMSIWAVLFTASSLVQISVARFIQSCTLMVGAMFTVYFGNFPVAALITTISVLIFWSYNRFKTLSVVGVFVAFALTFAMFFLGVLVSGYGYSPAYFIALIWTSAVAVGFFLIWALFMLFASDIVLQNRDLLELNKKLSKGDCQDVTTESRGDPKNVPVSS